MQPATRTPELDSQDEGLLRATLAEHAPTAVDTAHGWMAIAGQIGAARQNGHGALADATTVRPQWRRPRLPRVFTRLVAGVAVAAVLMAAGFGIVYSLSNKGNAIQQRHLYTVVNQRQTDQGVTIVVDRAYADSGSTSVLYYIELAPALAARGYTSASPLTFDLTSQYGDQGGGGNIICHPGSGAVLETCEMDQAPFIVPAGVTELTISFAIYRAVLVRGGDHSFQTVLQGNWSFAFTIPFHRQSLGSGGPYAQPCDAANPCGSR